MAIFTFNEAPPLPMRVTTTNGDEWTTTASEAVGVKLGWNLKSHTAAAGSLNGGSGWRLIGSSQFYTHRKHEDMGKPHLLVIPCPAQSLVIPLVNLSKYLAKQSIKITFVNTEFNHKRVIDAFGKNVAENGLLRLVSVPNALEDGEDRREKGKLTERLGQVMPGHLKELIHKINASHEDKISCVLADLSIGFVLDVAVELGDFDGRILAGFGVPTSGTPLVKDKMFQLPPMTPVIHPAKFLWLNIDTSPSTQKIMFHTSWGNNKAVETADWVVCNSSLELEPEGFNLVPKVLPIGPLPASDRLGNFFTVFGEIQFQELALGLELTNRPFLWVVREDITEGKHHVYPQEFIERVGDRGKMVSWAPQGAVLEHSSIACFISHCGWNSTIEGVSNGVPFLCWPYFADQFLNESYICDIWKIGLKFERDERGIIGKEEI
ncbi:UDP-glycosyltransferase 83A1-like [Hibiscus syriacus]|uniref:UDP-glycosyltransferase 83A1-like n=1 Tax=Hibiscus syriacus TaxID=106335 RepID=A0A6A3D3S6_HIBSY|nr:UDP-glycosyltransferase 83A1-like [Hibiscus syriacus]